MEAGVDKDLPIAFDELRAIAEEGLRDAGRHPGGIVQLDIRIGDQITVLFEVMRYGDHLAVAFDHQWLVTGLLEAHMEGVLGLEILQQIVGLQQVFNGSLKEGGHFGFSLKKFGGRQVPSSIV